MSVTGDSAAPAGIYDHREERCGIPRAVAGIGPVRAATLAWLFAEHAGDA